MPEIVRNFKGTRYKCRPSSNGVWYIYWSENRRSKRQSTGQKEEAAADAFLDEWLRIEDDPGAAYTCRDLWELKYGQPVPSDRMHSVYNHLMPVFGDLQPRDITQSLEDKYVRDRNVASSTIRLELSTLRASWNYAVQKRILKTDDLPALDPLPAHSPPRERWLRDDEIEALLDAAEHGTRVWAFLNIALETGARRNAIVDLEWDQVDLEIGTIDFLKEGEEQTKKRKACVPISKRLRPVLEYLRENSRDDYVIGAGGGINYHVTRAAKRAEIKGVTPHVLRHTAATRMARAGVSLWLIAKVLGNTLDVVDKVYAKHSPDMLADAVNSISGDT